MYIANIGDSIAASISNNKLRRITKEHKPANPEEYKRIEDRGGTIVEMKFLL